MRIYSFRDRGLLKNRKFLKTLFLAGIEIVNGTTEPVACEGCPESGVVIITNQEIDLLDFVRKWRMYLSLLKKRLV